ncbi:hypothetical protein COS12_01360 [Candidatus Roizmanbacteria bacterium CG01_land_8_20_14_3_00_33_9]|uniref:Uncharacterized protein n=1 Tax=Candidatus Roizmanbacteria bacterium CG01_land_8_20_14_3_00_33_9 TaxID=1974843 RepID=A0A2M7E4N7_9BACT|nr:MAG: hypothetical protein COS12_01360 [Candidatus Roizmanbacteria bacterium CG01_land_8_20_14_3_00_33_9]
MGKRQLFLKLTDLLLFSLLVKSQAGIDQIEQKPGIRITSPQEYLWIFLLYQKTNRPLSQSQQNSLVRVIFWMFQASWTLHDYYKNPKNRKTTLLWQHLLSKPKEFLHIRNCINKLKTEIQQSSLSNSDKQNFVQYIDKVGKEMFNTTQKIIHKNYNNFEINDVIYWYSITYLKISEIVVSLYLMFIGIKKSDSYWNDIQTFAKKVLIIGIAHDDVSDYKADIDLNGKLKEPNLFVTLLTKKEKQIIGQKYQGKYIFTFLEETKKNYFQAYSLFIKFIKNQLHEIDLIPGINLHELLEFYLFHFPEFFMIPISPDSTDKPKIAINSLQSITLLKKNIDLVTRFRTQIKQEKNVSQKKFNKQYLDLVSYLYAQQMTNSGLPLEQISSYINKPASTISHWLNENRLPLSLRIRKTKEQIDSNKLLYSLGIFAFSGSINKDGIKISSQNQKWLIKKNQLIDNTRKLIFKTPTGHYLRYYNRSLALKLLSLKSNLISTLQKCSTFEQQQFVQGLLEFQNNKQSLRLNKKIGKIFIDWLANYFQRNNQIIKINNKGNYYLITINNGKNRLVKSQQENNWKIFIKGDKTAKNTLIDQYQNYGKKIINQYFGQQKNEFWSELPSLMYLCLSQALDKYKEKYTDNKLLPSFLKYQILDYFRNYFKTNFPLSTTSSIDEVFEGKEKVDEVVGVNWETEKVRQALKKLEKKDRRLYLVLALRFGLYDGKEHALTDDLPKRLFELGIAGPNNQILSKSQTYQLLIKALQKFR